MASPRICERCERLKPHHAKGLCSACYKRAASGSTRGMLEVEIAARLEDLAFMAETNETFTRAAKRLGTTPKALRKWCQYHKANEIMARLRRNEGVLDELQNV